MFHVGEAASQPLKVRVGLYQNKPKVFSDQNGVAAGIFIDVLEEIAKTEKWKIEYVPCEWSECLDSLEKGDIDLMPDVAFSQERNDRFDFHKIPVIESWSQVYSKHGIPISRLEDLNGRRIAMLKGSIQQNVLLQTMNGFGYKVTIIPVVSFEEAFRAVKTGAADAAITNFYFGDFARRKFGLVKTPIVFNVVLLYYATAKGRNAHLLQAIDINLSAMLKEPNSVYYKTLLRWITPPPERKLPWYFPWVLCAIAGMLAFAAGVILLLRRQVNAKTKHLIHANEELKNTADMLHLALEATKTGIWDWRPETRLLIWNASSYTLLGYQPHEFTMTFDKWAELLHPDDREITINTISQLCNTGDRSFSIEFRQKHKNGGWVWIYGCGKTVEIDENGKARRVIGIHSDVTDRKTNENELQQYRERLEELVAERTSKLEKTQEQLIQSQKMLAVGQLAGGISHDFNNMLAVILGTSELIIGNLEPSDPNHARVSRIIKTGKRAKELTGRLLTFARKEKLEVRLFLVKDILLDVVDILASSITKKIIIHTSVPDDGLTIRGDLNQIGQALLNICLNACDAMKDGGTLKIHASPATLNDDFCRARADISPGDYCLFQIVDDGCGIPEHMLNRIFEPFFTTKEKGEGTGLGLSVTEGIVKMHNGLIVIESETGAGTNVKVYLPAARQQIPETDQESAGVPIRGKHETILVVDDELDFTDMTAEILSEQGYNPIVANNGRDAVDIFKKHARDIDLVLLDMMMPDMDGGEVFRVIHNIQPDVKVVICSGFSVEGKAENAMALGACMFIQKPYDMQSFLKTVSDALRK